MKSRMPKAVAAVVAASLVTLSCGGIASARPDDRSKPGTNSTVQLRQLPGQAQAEVATLQPGAAQHQRSLTGHPLGLTLSLGWSHPMVFLNLGSGIQLA